MEIEKRTPQTPGFYLPQLDGLRFVAFLLVFIHNANPILSESHLRKLSEYGWIGVDLFFCISAFLITKILVHEYKSDKTINSKNYLVRRILKIGPQYFLYIFLIYLFKDIIPNGDTKTIENLIGLGTFTYNIIYFYLFPSPVLLFVHLWSISFEFQYYLILPTAVITLINASTKQKTLLLSGVVIAGTVLRFLCVYFNFEHPLIYLLPFTHFESILGGVLLGTGVLDNFSKNFPGVALFILGLIFNLTIFLLPNNDIVSWKLLLTYPLLGIGMTLTVLSVLNNDVPIVSRLLTQKPIVYLGKISYGLYLFHIAAFFLTSRALINFAGYSGIEISKNHLLVMFISFAITYLVSKISYNLIERPFLTLKRR
jgi:peptidoglycan/LPS O-acetylase OafA/YrhL